MGRLVPGETPQKIGQHSYAGFSSQTLKLARTVLRATTTTTTTQNFLWCGRVFFFCSGIYRITCIVYPEGCVRVCLPPGWVDCGHDHHAHQISGGTTKKQQQKNEQRQLLRSGPYRAYAPILSVYLEKNAREKTLQFDQVQKAPFSMELALLGHLK